VVFSKRWRSPIFWNYESCRQEKSRTGECCILLLRLLRAHWITGIRINDCFECYSRCRDTVYFLLVLDTTYLSSDRPSQTIEGTASLRFRFTLGYGFERHLGGLDLLRLRLGVLPRIYSSDWDDHELCNRGILHRPLHQ
jgi:hypothetical protein